jgi:hypothetical protein
MGISPDTLIRFRALLGKHRDGQLSSKEYDELKELKERFLFEEPDRYPQEIATYGKPEAFPGSMD